MAEKGSRGDNHAAKNSSMLRSWFKKKKTTTKTSNAGATVGLKNPVVNKANPAPAESRVSDSTFDRAHDQNTGSTTSDEAYTGSTGSGSSQSGSNIYSYLHNGRKRRGISDLRITGVNRGSRG